MESLAKLRYDNGPGFIRFGIRVLPAILLLIVLCFAPARSQTNLDLKARVDTAIDYKNRTIDNWRSYGPVVMNRNVRFDSVTVNGFVQLFDVVFRSQVDISHSDFKPRYLLSNDSLRLDLVHGVSFDSDVSFVADVFHNTSDFRKGDYSGSARLDSSTFSRGVDFTGAVFRKAVSFSHTDFGDTAHFVNAGFQRGADFSGARFGKVAYFSGIDLGEGTTMLFTDATLPDTIDFSELQYLPLPVDFTAAAIYSDNKRHYLFLDRTDISHLILDYSHFGLVFKDPKKTSNAADTGIGRARTVAIYEGLLANFKSRGQFEDYNRLAADFRQYRVNQMNFFDRLWNIYASSPFHVIGGTLILFMFFSIINVFGYRALNEHVYAMGYFGPEVVEPEMNKRSRFTIRELSHSMIYTAFIFFSLTIKLDQLHFRSRGLLIWFFTIYVFGLTALFFLTHLIFSQSQGV